MLKVVCCRIVVRRKGLTFSYIKQNTFPTFLTTFGLNYGSSLLLMKEQLLNMVEHFVAKEGITDDDQVLLLQLYFQKSHAVEKCLYGRKGKIFPLKPHFHFQYKMDNIRLFCFARGVALQ